MGVNFTSFTLAIIMVSLCAVGFGAFMVDLGATYGVPIDPAYSNTYDKTNEILNKSNQITQTVSGNIATTDSISDIWVLQGTSAIQLGLQGTSLIKAMLLDAANIIGLPYWFIGGVLAMILVVLGYLAISALSRQFIQL